MARELGISKSYLSMILTGKRTPPDKLTQRISELRSRDAARGEVLSHARLPIPTLPRVGESKLMLAHISLFPVGTLDPLQVKDRIILPDTSANEPGGV